MSDLLLPPFWDFSFQAPDLDTVQRFGANLGSYTGAARQAFAYYAECRRRGIEVLGIQETDNGRALEGYDAGRRDAQFARQRWYEVGYTDGDPIAYAVSDGSRWDPSSGGELIRDYGIAVGDWEPGLYLFYGNRYAVDWACAGAAVSHHPERCVNLHGGWIPRTWDIDLGRDTAIQEVGAVPIPGIDVNTVLRPIHAAPAPAPEPKRRKSDMDLVIVQGDGFWVHNNEIHVLGPGKQVKRVDIDAAGNKVPLADIVNEFGWLAWGPMKAATVDKYVTEAMIDANITARLLASLPRLPSAA